MKRAGILVALVLMGVQLVHGHPLKSYGIKTGMSIASQSYSYAVSGLTGPEYSLRNFCIGGFAEWKGRGRFGFLTEVYYIRKGAADEMVYTDENGPTPLGTLRWEYRIDYISIPFMAKLNVEAGRSLLYGILGPRMDIRLGQNNKLIGYDVSNGQKLALDQNYSKLDLGLELGIGIERPVSSIFDLILEFRYSPSLTHVYDSELLSIRNQSYELLLGFRL